MAVNIDNVYQKLLALANKEQRGYITPQEFNLFADHAQMEIFEQYFYDLTQFLRVHGNSEEYSDIIDNIREKISIFEREATASPPLSLNSIYRLGSVFVETAGGGIKEQGIEVQEVQPDELRNMQRSPLLKPRASRPVYVRRAHQCYVYPDSSTDYTNMINTVRYTYVAVPRKPKWGYIVNNSDAMYDPGISTDFELHRSEEVELVYRILLQAGVSIQRQDITQAAASGQVLQVQQEKQ